MSPGSGLTICDFFQGSLPSSKPPFPYVEFF